MRNYQAANELKRVSTLTAFNVQGATRRRKVNQFSTLYYFADGSVMEILVPKGVGNAWHPKWKGTGRDVELGPVQGMRLLVNR